MEKKLNEWLNENDKSKSIHELVDILKVIYRIAELRGQGKESIEKLTNDKKGVFQKIFYTIILNWMKIIVIYVIFSKVQKIHKNSKSTLNVRKREDRSIR